MYIYTYTYMYLYIHTCNNTQQYKIRFSDTIYKHLCDSPRVAVTCV